MMRRRTHTRAFTLIELTVAIAVMGLFVGMAVTSVNAITDAELRSSARDLMGMIKLNYDRAVMMRRTQRLALDIDKGIWWVDFTESPFALSKEKMTGAEGVSADEAKDKLKKKDSDFGDVEDEDVRHALEGGAAAAFQADDPDEVGKPHPLPESVRFARVWTGHQEEPFTSGVAFIHFFKAGYSEPAMIELKDAQDDVVSIEVSPLTGKVKSKNEPFEDPSKKRESDDGRAEGDE